MSMVTVHFPGIHSYFFFSSRRRHTRSDRDWSSDVCSSDLPRVLIELQPDGRLRRTQLRTFFRGHVSKLELGYRWGERKHRSNYQPVCKAPWDEEIGRASCREGVWMWGVDVGFKVKGVAVSC